MNYEEIISACILGKTYWFTCALVVSEIFLFFLLLTRQSTIVLYLLSGVFTTILSYILVKYDVSFFGNASTPWYYKSGLVSVLFLAFGGLYWYVEEWISNFFSAKYSFLLNIVLIILYIYTGIFNSESIDCVVTDGTINFVGVLMSLVSTILLINICKLLPSLKFLNYVGRHSIGFYFFCGAAPNIIAVCLFKLGMSSSIVVTILCTILSLLAVTPVIWLLNKHLPFLFDLRLIR